MNHCKHGRYEPSANDRRRWRLLLLALSLSSLVPFLTVGARADTPSAAFKSDTNPAQLSDPLTLGNSCSAGLCVTVDSGRPIESASHQATGLLHSMNGSSVDSVRLAQLGVTMWRSSDQDWTRGVTPWATARSEDIPVTFVLSDKWSTDTRRRVTPWGDWTAYANWVTASVQQIARAGIQVDYWEVYNEPDMTDGSPILETSTPDRLLTQFLVAYRAIKSVLPDARVIGPSLSTWLEKPTAHVYSMAQFIAYAAANDIALAALSWHYNALNPGGVESQVAEARALMADEPALGQPKIFINEYGTEQTQRIPGWDVQYLAALTAARVDAAGRSCWLSDCFTAVFDGLLGPDGSSTLPDYWVRADYAQMTGTMVATSVSSDHAGALASLDITRSQLRVLLGYGKGCIQDPRCLSSTPWAVPSLPLITQVSIRVPWTFGHMVVQKSRIEGMSILPISEPETVSIGSLPIVIQSGIPTVTVNIDPVADGDAWSLTLTHTS